VLLGVGLVQTARSAAPPDVPAATPVPDPGADVLVA